MTFNFCKLLQMKIDILMLNCNGTREKEGLNDRRSTSSLSEIFEDWKWDKEWTGGCNGR